MNKKIGIRPTIDGRRLGVRESLEDKTMSMAKMAAKLIEENLKYADGTPVECVISDTCIGGVKEASDCADKFAINNVGASLTVTPCWCYGSETMDMDPHTPKAVWGFNGTQRPGAVYLAAVLAAHAQKGIPAFGIYGRDVQDLEDNSIPKDVEEKILRWARAAVAVAQMKGKSYLSIGGVSMGIAGSIVDPNFFQEYLGMRNEYVDSTELIRRMNNNIFDPEEYKKALAWTKENCKEGTDINKEPHSREEKDSEWETVVKMAVITKDLMQGNPKLAELGFYEESYGRNAIAGGFQGQRQWTDFMPNGDYMEAILNSSFDWNGAREPIVVATENDCLNGVAMLLSKLLTNKAQVFCDVRTYWSGDAIKRVTGNLPKQAENGLIHLINSGAAALDGSGKAKDKDGKPAIKEFWNLSEKEIKDISNSTSWRPANVEYFRGGGFSSQFLTEGGMPLTMVRINLVKGLGPVMQIAEGYSIDMPEESAKILWERTDSTWPTTWFVPKLSDKENFKDVYSVMANWGANHCSLSYGHIGADLITLASMLRIPVSMHNVDDDKIFRPHMFTAFGQDKEGADFRACQSLGAIYK